MCVTEFRLLYTHSLWPNWGAACFEVCVSRPSMTQLSPSKGSSECSLQKNDWIWRTRSMIPLWPSFHAQILEAKKILLVHNFGCLLCVMFCRELTQDPKADSEMVDSVVSVIIKVTELEVDEFRLEVGRRWVVEADRRGAGWSRESRNKEVADLVEACLWRVLVSRAKWRESESRRKQDLPRALGINNTRNNSHWRLWAAEINYHLPQ